MSIKSKLEMPCWPSIPKPLGFWHLCNLQYSFHLILYIHLVIWVKKKNITLGFYSVPKLMELSHRCLHLMKCPCVCNIRSLGRLTLTPLLKSTLFSNCFWLTSTNWNYFHFMKYAHSHILVGNISNCLQFLTLKKQVKNKVKSAF